jgi:hypothetical protein
MNTSDSNVWRCEIAVCQKEKPVCHICIAEELLLIAFEYEIVKTRPEHFTPPLFLFRPNPNKIGHSRNRDRDYKKRNVLSVLDDIDHWERKTAIYLRKQTCLHQIFIRFCPRKGVSENLPTPKRWPNFRSLWIEGEHVTTTNCEH